MRTFLIVLAAALATAPACSLPDVEPAPPPVASRPGPETSGPDPRVLALGEEVGALRTTVLAARDALVQARDATDAGAARAAAERAVHTLTAAPHLSGDLDGDGTAQDPRVDPLFPGPVDAIEPDSSYGDVFSRVLTAARSAGSAGRTVVELLRDPIAGSLAAWQEDAAGRLRTAEDVAEGTDVGAAEQRVAEELQGDATRALAWALMATGAPSLDVARAAAERGVVHLDLTLEGIDSIGDLTSPA